MNKYRVVVRGENFWMEVDGGRQRFGFFTTRYVEAPTPEEAEKKVAETVRAEPSFEGKLLNEETDPPRVKMEEIDQLESFDGHDKAMPGFTFFEDVESK